VESHSAKESAREVKPLLPAGARIQLDENAGDERGVTSFDDAPEFCSFQLIR
jgi:hypothetical protein